MRHEERIVVECSSGGREENIQHTYGDSLKLTKSLTAMLVLKAYKRSNASYKTFCKFKTIGIQCIKRTLTLFILFMDEEKKLVVEEKRSANVPICFDEIFDFMQVFELIAYLQVLVLEQEQVDKILRSEHTGITDVGNEEIISNAFADCKLDFEVDLNATEPELVGEQ
ncbi:hypothetical protein G6F56_011350 [Rhizopus delemar]|nr:hypothetical protein G6F56_011350 [Rhizopus delemar]